MSWTVNKTGIETNNMCIHICTYICVYEYFQNEGKKFTLWQIKYFLSEHKQNVIRRVCNFTQVSLKDYEEYIFYVLNNITVTMLEIQRYALCTAAGYCGYCGRLLFFLWHCSGIPKLLGSLQRVPAQTCSKICVAVTVGYFIELNHDWTKWRKFHLSVYCTGFRSRSGTARPGLARPRPTGNWSRFCEANNFFISAWMSWNFAFR